jgi:hypothetical protein
MAVCAKANRCEVRAFVVVTGTQPMDAPTAEDVLMIMQASNCAMVEVARTITY